MPIDKEKLKSVLSIFQKTEEGNIICPSEFVRLSSNVRLNRIWGVGLPPIGSFLMYISYDLTNIETLSSRLVWELDLADNGKLDMGQWMSFAQSDIDIFHIEMRSIFDYLARIIQDVSDMPKPIKKYKSFTKRRNWLGNEKHEENAKTLGDDLTKLVLSVDWFDDIRNVRDETLHRGANTTVFPQEGRVLFQVSKGVKNLISFPEVQYNENIIDFELYAGVYFGYLIAFLEEACKAVEKRLPPRKSAYGSGNPHRLYKELPAIYKWIEKVISNT